MMVAVAYQITITAEAESHLLALSVREQRIVQAAVASRLLEHPTTVTRAVKRLRPNSLAEFELRAGDLRVLYNVQGTEVVVLVVGRKVGNKLIVKGQEFHGHQDNPNKPPASGSNGDTQ
jgi:mRNA-degrading endonuclease RelE of RelBE toxin-antitoxin system